MRGGPRHRGPFAARLGLRRGDARGPRQPARRAKNPASTGDPEAVLYAGVAGSGAVGLWHDLHAALPDAWLLGTEGIAELLGLARPCRPTRRPARASSSRRAPLAFYGFEAMALILDAIAAGVATAPRRCAPLAPRETRDSVLGRYSLDADGHTTTTAYGRWPCSTARLV